MAPGRGQEGIVCEHIMAKTNTRFFKRFFFFEKYIKENNKKTATHLPSSDLFVVVFLKKKKEIYICKYIRASVTIKKLKSDLRTRSAEGFF